MQDSSRTPKLLRERSNQGLPTIHRSNSPKVSEIAHTQRIKSPSLQSRSQERLPDLKSSKNSLKLSGVLRQDQGKSSTRRCGAVQAYAVNSFPGRHHNEDRVNIMINLPRPENIAEDQWTYSSLFSLFDGHSGKTCAEFLKKNLHSYICKDSNFPYRSRDCLISGFRKADQDFLAGAKESGDMSGACALVVLIIGDKCIVANTGDSRAIISLNHGAAMGYLTNEHKPGNTAEYERIIEAGGVVYNNYFINERGENINKGPFYVDPGKLMVSRAFGDIDAKDRELGGNPLVLIVEPEIKSFKIKPEHDFIVMASGSLFEKLGGKEIVDIVIRNLTGHRGEDIGARMLAAISEIYIKAAEQMCEDNITIVIIGLKGIKKYFEQ